MCGRYLITTPVEAIRQIFQVDQRPNLAARYNVAPTQSVPIIRRGESGRELVTVRWGLVPFWAKDLKIGARMINAKAETVAEKPAFRDGYKRRRCLVLADGFYEWKKIEGGKQPYLIRLKSAGPLAFAGLWADWKDKESGERIESCTIITTEPNALMASIHNRMPAILPPEAYDLWLDPDAADGRALLGPFPAEAMEAYPVSQRVGNVRNEGPDLAEPIAVDRELPL